MGTDYFAMQWTILSVTVGALENSIALITRIIGTFSLGQRLSQKRSVPHQAVE